MWLLLPVERMIGGQIVLVNPDEMEEFANALSSLLESADYRASLGRAAYLRCRKMFDWDIIAQNWASLLEEVSGRSGSVRVCRSTL